MMHTRPCEVWFGRHRNFLVEPVLRRDGQLADEFAANRDFLGYCKHILNTTQLLFNALLRALSLNERCSLSMIKRLFR